MSLLATCADRGAEVFGSKGVHQIALWRIQGATNLMEASANEVEFAHHCMLAATQFKLWATDEKSVASTDTRWPETSRLLLEAAYNRADMRGPESPALPKIRDLFEIALTTVYPRLKDVLYKKEIMEMATTVKACKYDPSTLVQSLGMGALDGNKRGAIHRELSDILTDDLEAPESF